MPPTINELPPELLEELVDACTTYPKRDQSKTMATLRALSQTSSTFRPICQSKLFSTITILTEYDEYVEDTNPLDRLYELFVESDRLAQYATHLTILNKRFNRQSGPFADDEDKTHRDGEHTLTKLLTLLQTHSRLEQFTVVSIWPSRHHYGYHRNPGRCMALMKAIMETFKMPSLVRVNMKDMPLDLFRFCTPNVKHLALWDASVEWDLPEEDKMQAPIGEKIQLESLVMYSSSLGSENLVMEEIIDSEFLDLSGVRKLSVGLEHCRMVEKMHGQVAQLLERCSSSLEELSLTPSTVCMSLSVTLFLLYVHSQILHVASIFLAFDLGHDPPLGPESITFASLKSLRALHLGIQTGLCEDYQGNNHEPIPWLCSVLNTLPRPNVLESLTISSGYGQLAGGNGGSYWGVNFDDYAQLDVLLGEWKVPKLKKVRWFIEESKFLLTKFDKNYTTPGEFSKRAKWVVINIHGKMPQMRRKKKLEFEFGACTFMLN